MSSFFRLIVAPALVYVLGACRIQDPYLLATLVLVAAMPAAALGTVMCLTYGGDLVTTSQCMFLTTVLSLFTIPLVTMAILLAEACKHADSHGGAQIFDATGNPR